MNYYISDTHLFHKNVTEEGSNFDGRPFKTLEEMHQTIKENWNDTVTNADHVYILGDLAWKVKEDREKGYRPTAKYELHARSISSLHNEEGRVICLN